MKSFKQILKILATKCKYEGGREGGRKGGRKEGRKGEEGREGEVEGEREGGKEDAQFCLVSPKCLTYVKYKLRIFASKF